MDLLYHRTRLRTLGDVVVCVLVDHTFNDARRNRHARNVVTLKPANINYVTEITKMGILKF